jgi:hypothetical protein
VSSLSAERLYNLLPAIYRVRDEQQGKPLLALVSLIAREIEAIEENIDQLYDDQFIETCDTWVPPYIGDLIGYRPLHYGVATKAIRSARAEVANTIGYRRRKGTAAMLEQLARDVTDWPARAVEFFEQLATTQYMNHIRLYAPATADLRSGDRLRRLDGPFNTIAHTAEMRRPEGGSGRYNIPNVGIFLWRLLALPLSNVPLTPDPGDATGRRFRFNPLGADQPLFRTPVTETLISHIAEPINVPEPIDLRAMAAAVKIAVGHPEVADDYGPGESIVLARPDANPAKPPTPIDVAGICVCDLRDVAGGWAHETTVDPETIAIDPRLGRVVLGSNVTGPIVATFYTGFSREIGGGEYERTPSGGDLVTQRTASNAEALQPHLTALAGGGRLMIGDSLTYPGTLTFTVNDTPAGARATEVVVTARDGARPLIASSGPMLLDIGKGSRLVLEGLVISGGELQMVAASDDQPRELVLRHCTLVPGLSLNTDGTAVSPGAPSLTIAHPFADVTLEHCIVGALQVDTDAKVTITDCIVDAGSPEAVAFEGRVAGGPGAELTIVDSTVIGKMHVRLMTLASNTIFFARLAAGDTWKAPIWVERKQDGCVRFCFVPTGSLVPRRFRCVPDEAHPDALPHFTSLRYGDPGYAQLRRATDRSIREGAADESEIGVMRTLFQPQRETNLRIRLEEYLRFGLHAGIFYVT